MEILRKGTHGQIRAKPKYLNFCDANRKSLEEGKPRQIVWFGKSIYF